MVAEKLGDGVERDDEQGGVVFVEELCGGLVDGVAVLFVDDVGGVEDE